MSDWRTEEALKVIVLACCDKYPRFNFERLLERAKEMMTNGRTLEQVAMTLR